MYRPKKYYWLKFQKNFFDDLRIRKLENIPGGERYLLIFIKIMALSIDNAGTIKYEGVFRTIEEELSIKIKESENAIKIVLQFAAAHNMIIKMIDVDEHEYYLPLVAENIGSESDAARRKRAQREREKRAMGINSSASETLSQKCHAGVTRCHTETETKKETHTDKELEDWLNIYSIKANNPSAYMSTMRAKIETNDAEAYSAFREWKRDKKEREAKRTIFTYNYQSMVGKLYNGEEVIRVTTEEDLSTVHVFLGNGSDVLAPKQEIYTLLEGEGKNDEQG